MRTLIVSAAALLVAGCASQPQEPVGGSAVAGAAAPPATAVTTATRNPYPGYKRKQKDGRVVYCKKLSRLGTNFVDEYCLSPDELDLLEDRAQVDREQVRRNQTVCGTGSCGGG
ncbi:MAG TPA: hypothetical protein VFX69_09360 [Steroidobacteraceae bacterium]|jgi:hypothetical protein|nr:hypothetical protein [Steroidobacteraceae bacterium]